MLSKAAARLGEKLKPRTELGMSAADLGRELGVTSQAVSQWLRGDNLPRPEVMRKLQELTGIPMQDWTEPAEDPPDTERAAS